MKLYKITVTGTPTDLDDIHENPCGEYTIEAESENKALDEFHWTVPISCLDDFEIDIMLKD